MVSGWHNWPPHAASRLIGIDALREMTGGRGPDAWIDAVGAAAHGHGPLYLYDRAMQAARLESDRPTALHEAIKACRSGGAVSVIGVYGGYIDRFPMGAVMNRSFTGSWRSSDGGLA